MQVILSFDVEEHDRIEAAAGLAVPEALKAHYRERLAPPTQWLLDELGRHGAKATFFVVGQIAGHAPQLVKAIHRAGHEVASHGWDHRRVAAMTPAEFSEDVRKSKDALEEVTGSAVVGYRAPTFSIGPRTPWAIDVLAEAGMAYDSSIYPVRHDRYGVPGAPRGPFRVRGETNELLELPPATWRVGGVNVPMGGGGYFRLFPLALTERAIRQTARDCGSRVATLYFHPWEFDPEQEQLPLGRVGSFRTYVGVKRTRGRLRNLLGRYRVSRAADVAARLEADRQELPAFALAAGCCTPAAAHAAGVNLG